MLIEELLDGRFDLTEMGKKILCQYLGCRPSIPAIPKEPKKGHVEDLATLTRRKHVNKSKFIHNGGRLEW